MFCVYITRNVSVATFTKQTCFENDEVIMDQLNIDDCAVQCVGWEHCCVYFVDVFGGVSYVLVLINLEHVIYTHTQHSSSHLRHFLAQIICHSCQVDIFVKFIQICFSSSMFCASSSRCMYIYLIILSVHNIDDELRTWTSWINNTHFEHENVLFQTDCLARVTQGHTTKHMRTCWLSSICSRLHCSNTISLQQSHLYPLS